MNIKNNKRAQQSVNKIRFALNELLQKCGHKNLSITQICKSANINRATFYSHYDSIEDALYQMCEEYIKKVFSIFLNKTISYKEKIYLRRIYKI